MGEVIISSIKETGISTPLEQLSHNPLIEEIPYISIACLNWDLYTYKPETSVKIAKFIDGLFLHFKVYESNVRALVSDNNGPVYTDSCVEFFIDPVGDGFYYNFEFNCIGSVLLGYGNSRYNREKASDEVISLIKRKTSQGEDVFEGISGPKWWDLYVFIPFTCFFKHHITDLKRNFSGNFYKCGDSCKIPHYITWNPVKTEKPDFHRPEYFGKFIIE